ncbi:protein lin-52 homolog [Planococcus citri]|uniref:protein lin-52 homolog n=1 Tax=Planococcus citri TaxID=170843 RepID=UPI0031F8FABC
MTEVDPSLIALETLDRTSPELWPEPIPGVSGFAHLHTSFQNKSQQPWNGPLDKEDYAQMNYYGSLSQKELIAEVKKLYDVAYNLGCEEAKEMTRGKYLHILQKKKNH